VVLCAAAALSVTLALRRRTTNGYERTEVLRYLPEDCPAARVYVDVAGLWRALGSTELVTSARQRGAFRDLVGALDSAGINPGRDIQDFAICARELGEGDDARSSVYVAIGGSLGGEKALSRYKSVIMTLSHVDERSIVEGQKDGVPYLVSKYQRHRMWIAMPAPNVLVFSTDDVGAAGTLRTPHTADSHAWQAEAGTTAGAVYTSPREGLAASGFRGRITDDGKTLELVATLWFGGLRDLSISSIETLRSATATILDGSPLRSLAAPVRAMDLVLSNEQLQVDLRVPGPSLSELLKEALADPSSLRRIMSALASKPATRAVVAPGVLRAPPPRLINRIAYIPPACFTMTRGDAGTKAHNPCYVCHTRSQPPNFIDDDELQRTLTLPALAGDNPWTNLFDPLVTHAPRVPDPELLAYVRQSNYVADGKRLLLADALAAVPPAWDLNGNGTWDGYKPDVGFDFDDRGFDHLGGRATGWRAFAYYPFPGTFFPTNGSADDVLIRLDTALQQDRQGTFDRTTYEVNLAIVEALVTRADVAIDPVDEAALGVDLDLDGQLGRTARVVFDEGASGASRMHYVGRAREDERKGLLPIAPGLFPVGTEFFHTVRYLDVDAAGAVVMAPRMKEVRYAKKLHWASYEAARASARREAREQSEASSGTHEVPWQAERGVYTHGWVYQGFIEAADGSLRPQSYEETASCEGCHGGIGATSDSVFSFARKLGASSPARGWFHWSQHDLKGIPEPKQTDGRYEYSTYLGEAGGGDELRENQEVLDRFFDDHRELRPGALSRLHDDISYLLLPSGERALALDRAYLAVVRTQAFDKGRDAVLAPARNVFAHVPLGQSTGILQPINHERLVGPPR